MSGCLTFTELACKKKLQLHIGEQGYPLSRFTSVTTTLLPEKSRDL